MVGHCLRWSETVKGHQEGHKPCYSVDRLDWKLCCSKQEGKQRHVARYGQRSKRAKISPIFESNQAEWDNNKQYGLFVNVPPKQEGRITAEGDSADECVPGRLEK